VRSEEREDEARGKTSPKAPGKEIGTTEKRRDQELADPSPLPVSRGFKKPQVRRRRVRMANQTGIMRRVISRKLPDRNSRVCPFAGKGGENSIGGKRCRNKEFWPQNTTGA